MNIEKIMEDIKGFCANENYISISLINVCELEHGQLFYKNKIEIICTQESKALHLSEKINLKTAGHRIEKSGNYFKFIATILN